MNVSTTTTFELIDPAELVPYVNNARTHSDEQIAKLRASLREFGFVSPIVIDADKNVLVGHGRLKAAQLEGLDKVPCVLAEHLTEAQKKAYIIADNRMAEDAGWDNELLRIELEELENLSFDLSLTGFDGADLDKLLALDDDIEEDDFDVDAELERPPLTKTGDVWHLGEHTLICGDATKAETYERLLADKRVNLVVTDPPYNVNYQSSAGKIKNDNMADDAFYNFLLSAFKNVEGAMADDASIYVFHADTEGLNFRRAFKDAGFYLSGTCIWKKNSLVLGRSPYQWQHEPCLYGWKQKGKHAWYADRKQTTIWEFDRPKKSADHPTMKPIALMAYPIKNSTMSGCLVLDPFSGSGSTLLACVETERVFCGVELEEKYCDVTVKRYIERTGSTENITVERDGKTIKFDDL